MAPADFSASVQKNSLLGLLGAPPYLHHLSFPLHKAVPKKPFPKSPGALQIQAPLREAELPAVSCSCHWRGAPARQTRMADARSRTVPCSWKRFNWQKTALLTVPPASPAFPPTCLGPLGRHPLSTVQWKTHRFKQKVGSRSENLERGTIAALKKVCSSYRQSQSS